MTGLVVVPEEEPVVALAEAQAPRMACCCVAERNGQGLADEDIHGPED